MQKRIAEGRFENWAEVGNAQAKYEHPCYNKEEILSILPAASTKVGKISTNSTRREDLSVGGGNYGKF